MTKPESIQCVGGGGSGRHFNVERYMIVYKMRWLFGNFTRVARRRWLSNRTVIRSNQMKFINIQQEYRVNTSTLYLCLFLHRSNSLEFATWVGPICVAYTGNAAIARVRPVSTWPENVVVCSAVAFRKSSFRGFSQSNSAKYIYTFTYILTYSSVGYRIIFKIAFFLSLCSTTTLHHTSASG